MSRRFVAVKRAPLGRRDRVRLYAAFIPTQMRLWRRRLRQELVCLPTGLVRAAWRAA